MVPEVVDEAGDVTLVAVNRRRLSLAVVAEAVLEEDVVILTGNVEPLVLVVPFLLS